MSIQTLTVTIEPSHDQQEKITFVYGRKEQNNVVSVHFAQMLYDALLSEAESVGDYAEFKVSVKFEHAKATSSKTNP